jgi:hypothetical protein
MVKEQTVDKQANLQATPNLTPPFSVALLGEDSDTLHSSVQPPLLV